MSNPKPPSDADVETACEIAKFLSQHGREKDGWFVLRILSECSAAAGFAMGLLEMSKLRGELNE